MYMKAQLELECIVPCLMILACKLICSFQMVSAEVDLLVLLNEVECLFSIFSILTEPGYYEKGQFGIRIEDIVQIVPINIGNNFNGRGALTFKTVTMCPIQTKLINKSLMTDVEVSRHLSKPSLTYNLHYIFSFYFRNRI